MKKIRNFIKDHKTISWVIGIFIGIVLIDSILNNDFENLKSLLYSLAMLCVYLYILYLITSKRSYLCPKCQKKIKKGDPSCKNCGEVFNSETNSKPISKRIFLKSKLFFMIGEAFVSIPLGLGFLYLIFSPIVFATNGESFSVGNTLFVCYTNPNMLGITIPCSLIGFVLVLVGLYYKKKER